MQIDHKKLKLLANSTEEYLCAYRKKLMQYAESNGHEMVADSEGFSYTGLTTAGAYYDYNASCAQCSFGFTIEYFEGVDNTDRIRLTGENIEVKCCSVQNKI